MKSKFKQHFLLFFLFSITQVALYAQNNSDDITCQTPTIKGEITPACQGRHNGRIDLTIENGMPPYRIEWENGASNKYLKALPAGIYRVTVIDALGCRGSANFNLPAHAPLRADINVQHNKKAGKNQGTIEVQVNGGEPPYRFSWFSSALGMMSEVTPGLNNMKDLPAGLYKVVVFDAAGCYYEIETEVRDK